MKPETKQEETKQNTKIQALDDEELEQAAGGVGGGNYETPLIFAK